MNNQICYCFMRSPREQELISSSKRVNKIIKFYFLFYIYSPSNLTNEAKSDIYFGKHSHVDT